MFIQVRKAIIKKQMDLSPGIIILGRNWVANAVQTYNNSLILRLCMTEKPFLHKKAYANVKSNFLFQEDAAKIILKVIKQKV